MATITTRAGKGSPLTNTEVDDNFSNLNSAKYESGSSPTFASSALINSATTVSFTLDGASANSKNIYFKGDSSAQMGRIASIGTSLYFQLTDATNYFTINPGSTVINDSSVDHDFRVESNDHTHALFVDASRNMVAVDTSDPDYLLDVGNGTSSPAGGKVMRINSSGDTIFTLAKATSDLFSIRNNSTIYTALSSNNGAGLMLGFGTGSAGAINNHQFFSATETSFNNVGQDRDFRVETENNDNTLFVNASTDRVGIKNNNPQYDLHVSGTAYANNLITSQSIQYNLTYGAGGGVHYIGKLRHNSGTDGYLHFTLDQAADHGNTIPVYLDVVVKQRSGVVRGHARRFGRIISGNDCRIKVVTDDNSANIEVWLEVDDYLQGMVNITKHSGHDWSTSKTTAQTSGTWTTLFDSDESMVMVQDALHTVVNEGGIDHDFRVETDDKTHALFVEGETGRVGLGSSDPSRSLHIADSQEDPYVFIDGSGGNRDSGIIIDAGGGERKVVRMDVGANMYFGNSNEFAIYNNKDIVFNSGGHDADFTVKSDGNANMLFVDAGTNGVGIGKVPHASYALDVDGQILQNGRTVSGIVYNHSTYITRPLNDPQRWYKIYSHADASSQIVKLRLHHGGDNTHFEGEFTITMAGYGFKHSINCENYQYYNTPHIEKIATRIVNNTTLEIWVQAGALTQYAGNFGVYSNSSSIITPVAGSEPTGLNAVLSDTHFNGNAASRSSMAVSKHLHIANESHLKVFRSDDTRSGSLFHNNSGTVLRTNNAGDNLYLQAGGSGDVNIQPTVDGYSTIVNEDSNDVDFRVESNSNTHMLFVDAGANHVNIGTSLDTGSVLNVAGDIAQDHGASRKIYRGKFINHRGVSDGVYAGYLLLVPYNSGSAAAGAAMEGTFVAHRGNSGSGNGPARAQVWASAVYTSTVAWFKREGAPQSFTRLVRVTYNSVEYIALKMSATNGGMNNGIFYDGWSIRADANFLFMARDTEISNEVDYANPLPYHSLTHPDQDQVFENAVTFNEAGFDKDFRVESTDRSHMLFVDASGDCVHINRTSFAENSSGISLRDDGLIQATRSAGDPLSLRRTTNYGQMIAMRYGTSSTVVGSVDVNAAGITYLTVSDRRLKDNIELLTGGTEKLMAMNPVTHTWIERPEAGTVQGFIAQEMFEVCPEAVSGTPDGAEMMSMDYGRITPVLVAALQDAHKKIAELETRLNELEGK